MTLPNQSRGVDRNTLNWARIRAAGLSPALRAGGGGTTISVGVLDCDTQYRLCKVGCYTKYAVNTDPFMLQGCLDSCAASHRLCGDFGVDGGGVLW